MIRWDITDRGFKIGTFFDHNRHICAVIESSLATEECIWIGRKAEDMMHLTREQAGKLALALSYFSEHGKLP